MAIPKDLARQIAKLKRKYYFVRQFALPPRGVKGSPENLDRCRVAATIQHAWKLSEMSVPQLERHHKTNCMYCTWIKHLLFTKHES